MRRRRGLTLVLVLAAVAMGSAAAAYARVGATTVDRSFACAVKLGGPHAAYFNVAAGAKDPPANVAYWSLYLANKIKGNSTLAQMSFGSASKGLRIDRALCKQSSAKIPLRSSRLNSGNVVTSSYQGSFTSRCPSARRALVRIHLQENKGVPVRAKVAIISDNAKKSPIANIVWGPTKITYFLANGCS